MVRTHDQHGSKIGLKNPFGTRSSKPRRQTERRGSAKPTSGQNSMMLGRMPNRQVSSKIKSQIARDKELSRQQKLENERLGKQSARVQIYVPERPVPIREPSPKRTEQTDEEGYQPGQSAFYEEESDYDMSGDEGGPVAIAEQAMNSPLMNNFTDA